MNKKRIHRHQRRALRQKQRRERRRKSFQIRKMDAIRHEKAGDMEIDL